MAEKPLWMREHGKGYAVPPEIEQLVACGVLVDASWHNDTHPHFEAKLKTDVTLDIWVDHPNPKEREAGPAHTKRYGVYVEDCDTGTEINLYYGDDLDVVLSFIHHIVEANKEK